MSKKKKAKLLCTLVQVKASPKGPLSALEKARNFLGNYKKGQRDFFIFPEMWPCGFSLKNYAEQHAEYLCFFECLKDLAKEKGAYLSGTLPWQEAKKIYNSAYLINPRGRLQALYHKKHLFKFDDEHKRFAAGKDLTVSSIAGRKCGLSICYDLRFPEMFRELVLERKSDFIIVPAAWPKARMDHFKALLKARAIENQVSVLAVNQVGKHERGFAYGGGSCAFDAWGNEAGSLGLREACLDIDIDLKAQEKLRKDYPFLKDSALASGK